jgi:hypothetical protein
VKNAVWFQIQNKNPRCFLLQCPPYSPLISNFCKLGLPICISVSDSYFQRNLPLQNLLYIKLPLATLLCPILDFGKVLRLHLLY